MKQWIKLVKYTLQNLQHVHNAIARTRGQNIMQKHREKMSFFFCPCFSLLYLLLVLPHHGISHSHTHSHTCMTKCAKSKALPELFTVSFLSHLENMTMCMQSEFYLEKFQKFIMLDYLVNICRNNMLGFRCIGIRYCHLAKFIYKYDSLDYR